MTKKMSRKEFVKKLLDAGKSTEEIMSALEKGDAENGINPITDPRFIKLVATKLLKELKK